MCFQPEGPSRDLLRDCEIFVASSITHPVFQLVGPPGLVRDAGELVQVQLVQVPVLLRLLQLQLQGLQDSVSTLLHAANSATTRL